jgi:NRPS condensation-like uncharacterized protein
MEGEVESGRLRRSLERIVQRHEALRTRFEEREGAAYQVVGEVEDFEVAEEAVGSEEELRRICEEEGARAFDLGAGGLFRARILVLSPREHVLLVNMHHTVSDGWSVGVFFRELVSEYAALGKGEASSLKPLGIQYGDYALWQREWLSGELLRHQREYWREQLADMKSLLEVPSDRPRPAVKTYRGRRERFQISAQRVKELNGLSVRHEATLFMTLLAIFDVLLWRYTNEGDIAVGTPIANRTQAETEELIGFLNTL